MMGYFSSAITKYNSAATGAASHAEDTSNSGSSSSSASASASGTSGSAAAGVFPPHEDHILTVAEAAAAMPPHSDEEAVRAAKRPRRGKKSKASAPEVTDTSVAFTTSATTATAAATTTTPAASASTTATTTAAAPVTVATGTANGDKADTEEPQAGEGAGPGAQPSRRQLTYEEKVAIIAAYECGKTFSEIAQAFGRYVSTISRFINHYKATKSFDCKAGRGSKRKTTDKDDKALVRIVMHDRFLTSRKVMEALPTLNVSQRTVRRRMAELSRFKSIQNTSVV